jgi:dipeptidyl aminopeptidase/acylaminoacyl peptidase
MPLPPLIEVERFFADPQFAGASLSSDGSRIAYLAPHGGRMNVWVRGLDQEHEDAVCVTRDSRRGIHSYYWTDDPRWLLYLQDTDGNEDWHLYRVDLDDPRSPAVDLTQLSPGSRVWAVAPFRDSPGSVLVTMNKRPLFFEPFVVDVASGETTLLLLNESMLGQYLVGPGGETFFAGLTPDGSAWEYFAVGDDPEERRLIGRFEGDEYPMGTLPAVVAADGKGLLLGLYCDSDDLSLVRLDAETGEQTVVAGVPGRSVCTASYVAPSLPPSVFTCRRTGEVIAVRFVGDRPHIEVVDPDFEEVYAALSRLTDGVLSRLSSDVAGRRWLATFEHDREPDLTYLYDRVTGESRLLFRPHPDLDPSQLAPMTGVSITARDGLPLHGFLTLPVGLEPTGLPLVLRVHGGPWFHDVWRYDPEVQFLANRGYAVLQVNFRGSSGYGRRHTTSAIGEFAGAMHDDLIDAAEWAA